MFRAAQRVIPHFRLLLKKGYMQNASIGTMTKKQMVDVVFLSFFEKSKEAKILKNDARVR